MTEDKSKAVDVVSIGIAVVDALGRPVDQYPEKGKLTTFDEMVLSIGGCASATAVTLARLGARVSLSARIGSDALGDFFLKYVGEAGVDTSHVVRDENAPTAFTFVAISSDGDRTFFHCPGADSLFSADDLDMGAVSNAAIVHVGGSLVMETFDGDQTVKVLETARAAGAMTSLDTAYNSAADPEKLLGGAYAITDYFFTGYEEGQFITGKSDCHDIASYLRDRGCGTVIVKLGEKGSYILDDGGGVDIEPFPATVVDTCGAGDVYVGGFLFGVSQGWPVEKCGRAGSLLASYCVSSMGGTTGVPKIEDLGYLESVL
jgi:sugar/nucleoside kinase (ribokinase family)